MTDFVPNRLHEEIAHSIVRDLKAQGAAPGFPLLELELCRRFKVSRTPVRGALKLLAARGLAEWRSDKGYMMSASMLRIDPAEPNRRSAEDDRLFLAILRAHAGGNLPQDCTLERIVRQLNARKPAVLRVMHQMTEMGVAEKKPGKGWLFNNASNRGAARAESYAFRRVVEAGAIMEPGFCPDHAWIKTMRARHIALAAGLETGQHLDEFHALNCVFHEELARFSGNIHMAAAIRQQLRRFLPYSMDGGSMRAQASLHEHIAMLDALGAGRNADAARMMRTHLADHTETEHQRLAEQLSIAS